MWGAALLGLGASAQSSWVHYKILTDPSYASICDVNATVSCTNAYASVYGSVGGVPTALLGVVFFGLVLLTLALTGRSAVSRAHTATYVLLLS